MRLVGEELNYQINQQDNIAYCQLGGTGRRRELHLYFNQILMNSYDISKNSISQSLSAFNSGTSSGSKLKIDDKEYDIVIKEKIESIDSISEQELRTKDMADLKNLTIKNNKGGIHTISEIATTKLTSGPSWINRVNGEKRQYMWFGFNFGQKDVPQDLINASREEIQDLIDSYPLPPGIAVELVEQEDSFADFRFLMLAAAALIFMILASVFDSLSTPFVLLFTIPLAAIVSLFALFLADFSLSNINILIGFLILFGVLVIYRIIFFVYLTFFLN